MLQDKTEKYWINTAFENSFHPCFFESTSVCFYHSFLVETGCITKIYYPLIWFYIKKIKKATLMHIVKYGICSLFRQGRRFILEISGCETVTFAKNKLTISSPITWHNFLPAFFCFRRAVSLFVWRKYLLSKKPSILITLALISRKIWYSNDDTNCLQSSQYLQSIAWEWIKQCITVHAFYRLQYYLMLIKYFLELKCMALDSWKPSCLKE